MSKEIQLGRGYVALVDDADYELVLSHGPWHASGSGRTKYARHSYSPARQILMHVLITGWDQTDHINLNGLDNRRANLRQATRFQNLGNRSVRPDSKSGLKGVTRYHNKWKATCVHRYLGLFPTAEAAARAYDQEALRVFGEFARLNYPEESAA